MLQFALPPACLTLILAALAAPQNAPKPADPVKPDVSKATSPEVAKSFHVADLAWMAGKWRGEFGRSGIGEEHWSEPRAKALMGMFRLGSDSKTQNYEFMLIEEGEKGVHMRSVHYGAELKPAGKQFTLPATRLTGDEVVFEDPLNADIRGIVYKRAGADALTVELSLVRDGSVQKEEYRMERMK